MKTAVPFLETGHLLEQCYKGCFRLDTDDPGLGHIHEHKVKQEAQWLFALFGNRLYPDVGEGLQALPGVYYREKRKKVRLERAFLHKWGG